MKKYSFEEASKSVLEGLKLLIDVNDTAVNTLKKNNIYHYAELAGFLRTEKYINYSRDEQRTTWYSSVPPNLELAKRIVDGLRKQASTKSARIVAEKHNNRIFEAKKYLSIFKSTYPYTPIQEPDFSTMNTRELSYFTRNVKMKLLEVQELEAKEKQDEIKNDPTPTGSIRDRVDATAAKQNISVPWEDSKYDKDLPEAKSSHNTKVVSSKGESVTKSMLELIKETQQILFLEDAITAKQFQDIIQQKFKSNPSFKKLYSLFIQNKI